MKNYTIRFFSCLFHNKEETCLHVFKESTTQLHAFKTKYMMKSKSSSTCLFSILYQNVSLSLLLLITLFCFDKQFNINFTFFLISFQVDHKQILYSVHSSSLHCRLLDMKDCFFHASKTSQEEYFGNGLLQNLQISQVRIYLQI